MAYIPDLSDYDYHPEFQRPGTKAVGWLDQGHDFQTALPSEVLLGVLWEFCKTSVAQMRGVHTCPFCQDPTANEVQRGGKCLLLGTSEIRVFSRDGNVYAAPTLMYHYVADHHYRPPAEFVNALFEGPRPASEEYFALLQSLNLEWRSTSEGGGRWIDPYSVDGSK